MKAFCRIKRNKDLNETINRLEASAFIVPTDLPESDGTAKWDSTTLILVELGFGKISGLGYSYASESCVPLIREKLFPTVRGKNPLFLSALRNDMSSTVRNYGRQGIASSAMAAVEIALWDLKAKMLKLPLVQLLGAVREKIAVYGSGGFTSYSEKQLCSQFENWVGEGISAGQNESLAANPIGTKPVLNRPAKLLEKAQNCLWTPTAPSRRSRPCTLRKYFPNKMSAGLKNRFHPTIWKAYVLYKNAQQ